MIYFILTCLAIYILLAGAECTAHYFGCLKQPWTRLRFFVGSVGAIVLAVSTAGWAGFIPASMELPVSLEGVKEISQVKQADLLPESSFQSMSEPKDNDRPLSKKSDKKIYLESQAEVHWYIYHYSSLHGVDPLLVQAIIRVESGFNPRARSGKGAMGLMQINKVTAKHLGLKNPYDVRENIEGGTRYLKTLLKNHYWNVRLALASYNAGPTVVARYKGIPPFQETRRYIWRVLSEYKKLKLVSKVFKKRAVRPPRMKAPITSLKGKQAAKNLTSGKKATRVSYSP